MRELELTERILRLRTVPTLSTLSGNDLAPLAASLVPVGFLRGETLLREHDPPRSFFLVIEGTVALHRRGKRIGTVRGPGGVGFISFLARSAGGTSAIAESYVETLVIDAEAMEEVFDDHFSVLLGTVRFVAERLSAELEKMPPPPRVAPTLLFEPLIGEHELGVAERIFIVRHIVDFAEANLNTLATLAGKMVELRKGAGEVLWRNGDPSEHSYFVVRGSLGLRWNEGKSVQIIGPGSVIGGAESLVGLPRWNDLVTEEPVVLLRSGRDALIDLFEDDQQLALRFLSMLATHLVTIWDEKEGEGIMQLNATSERD